MTKNIFILGRQPNLGIAELESLFGGEKLKIFNESTAVYDDVVDQSLIKKLGGTQKIGLVISEIEHRSWPEIEDYIREKIIDEILDSTEGKINLGISCYGVDISMSQLNGSNIALKKVIKQRGRSIRIIPNKDQQLSTAQVLHNQLVGSHGFELLIISGKSGLIFAKTVSIQDINGYASRDQNRPKRDARVGMLPPKLAQIMINLANPLPESLIVDPFCGTGVILQEALLMGLPVFGSDINERMIDYSKVNLRWLEENWPKIPKWQLEVADATTYKWNHDNSVVSETLLGKPLISLPPPNELKKEADSLNRLIVNFLNNLAGQLEQGTKICIAVPAWVSKQGFVCLPLLDHLEKIGYNFMSFKNVDVSGLIYYRPNQLVARQLLVLIRK